MTQLIKLQCREAKLAACLGGSGQVTQAAYPVFHNKRSEDSGHIPGLLLLLLAWLGCCRRAFGVVAENISKNIVSRNTGSHYLNACLRLPLFGHLAGVEA